MPSKSIFVSGWRAPGFVSTMAVTPSRISASLLSSARFVVGIVRADHEYGDFGLDAVQLAMFKTPEDMLRAVAADAEIDDTCAGRKIPARRFFAAPSQPCVMESPMNSMS